MKRTIQFFLVFLFVMFAATTSLSQEEAKRELYQKFTAAYNRGREARTTDPDMVQAPTKEAYNQASKEAYNLAVDYVRRYPNDTDDISNFLKKYIGDYEKWLKQQRKTQLTQLIGDKKYDEGFSLGRQILLDEPDDLLTLYTLARGGLFAAIGGNEANNSATIQYAKGAIQLVQAGVTLEGISKDETLGVLNYALGVASLKTAPAESVNAFLQVATQQNSSKSDPQIFSLLAVAYQSVDYEKLSSTFNTQCRADPKQLSTEPCKALSDKLNAVIDRIVDAYGRAVSLSGTLPQYAAAKNEWLNSLVAFYKYRHGGKTDGIENFLATVVAKPLP